MRLFHATLNKNRDSIGGSGINPSFSRGARRECWFVTAGKVAWAVLHVIKRHKVSLGDVVVYECLVPARRTTRRRRGVYTVREVVDPLYVVDLLTGEQVSDRDPD